MFVLKVKGKDEYYHKSADTVKDLQHCTTYQTKQAAKISLDSITIYPGCVFTSNTGIFNKNKFEIREVKLVQKKEN